MRKKKLWLLPVVIASLALSGTEPARTVWAAEDIGYEEDTGDEEETEPPVPESYNWTIESNETKGWPAGPKIEAEAAAVMDADTGAFLYSKNMNAKEYPASITKIMTALLAVENAPLDAKITFSEEAVYTLEEGSSHAGIQVGEIMTMEQALYGLMLESANDIANGIAEEVGGSQKGFADMMNQRAKDLGCTNTHFVNAHGLHSEEHYTCAKDMAIITREAIKNPLFREFAGTTHYTCPKTNKVDEERYWYNHNQMIQPEAMYYYVGCLGGKNGFTEDALNTLVTYAQKDGRTLICVEIRVNGKDKAYSESHAMLDYAFENFENISIPVIDENKTRCELLGVDYLGMLGTLRTEDLNQTAMKGEGTVKVSVPKGTDSSKVTCSGENGGFDYSFNGWNVGHSEASFSPLFYQVPVPQTVPLTYTEQEETEPGIKGMAQVAVRKTKAFGRELVKLGKSAGKAAGEFFEDIPGGLAGWKESLGDVMKWLNENDIMAAVLGLILLIILLPILGIALARNAKSQKIRKMRKKEREERTRIEKSIDSKSVSEIEAELRAEIERDRLERQNETDDVWNDRSKEE